MQKGIDYTAVGVCYFCHDGKGNVLFNKRGKNSRDEQGCWDVGGGGIELGDSVVDSLRKEIFEEYCTDVLDYEFLGYRDLFREYNSVKTHWIMFDFKVLVDRKKVKNGEPHKLDTVDWFTKDNFPNPVHSQFPKFLEKYKDRL